MSAATLCWPGSKHRLARRIVALMPPHTCYAEPFAGSLAVLFAKPFDGVAETVNDLDGRLINFWSVLREEDLFWQFCRRDYLVALALTRGLMDDE